MKQGAAMRSAIAARKVSAESKDWSVLIRLVFPGSRIKNVYISPFWQDQTSLNQHVKSKRGGKLRKIEAVYKINYLYY